MKQHKIIIQNDQGNLSSSAIINPQINLVNNLAYLIIKDSKIIELYKSLSSCQMSKHIIYPITISKVAQQWSIIHIRYGQSLSSISQEHLQEISTQDFLKKFSLLYYHLRNERPIITLNSIYTMEKQPFKILLKDCWQSDDQYIKAYHRIIKILYSKDIYQKIKMITDISILNQMYSIPKEGKQLSKLLEMKFIPVKQQIYKINIESADIQWLFKSLSFSNLPKYQLIYNGIQNNFDPNPLLKAIVKQHIFYLIESQKGDKIVFYPGIKYQGNSGSLFGVYLVDKQKKSTILGLKKHSIHALQEEQYAVGYGNEVLLAIGKVDFVFSAFNVTNVSHFPVSYRQDDKAGVSTAQDLLGNSFTLKQLEVYKIL